MPKFDVHLYCVVRVKLAGIEAESQVAAIEEATGSPLLDRVARQISALAPPAGAEAVEWAESVPEALVDVQGDEEYRESTLYRDGKNGWEEFT